MDWSKVICALHQSAEAARHYGHPDAFRVMRGLANAFQSGLQAGDDMTKKDYVALARAVREVRDGMTDMTVHDATKDAIVELVAARLSLMCAKDNKQFDSMRFAAACKGRRA